MMRRQLLPAFIRSDDGAMADTFALVMVPMMMLGGIAVDFTRASAADSKLQNAADSVLLNIARNSESVPDEHGLVALAQAQMAAMLPESYEFTVSAVDIEGSTLTLNAEGSIPAGITGILGHQELNQAVSSEVVWGADSMAESLELALVLDNTGSMGQYGRMTQLKDASEVLLDVLQTAEPGHVKVAIVPFDVNVRVPTSYKTASWFKTEWWVNWFWQGCLADRDQNYDVGDALVTSNAATKYPPALCSSNQLSTIQPLTTNFSTLYSKVSSMTPAGNTNITIGLSWGLTLLSSQAPFIEGTAPNTEGVRKIMVLMTDGDNTENRWSTSPSSIDARTELACAAVKNAGIDLYVVRLMEGNGELLEACASSSDTYYDVENVADLVPTFRAIGHELASLRISR